MILRSVHQLGSLAADQRSAVEGFASLAQRSVKRSADYGRDLARSLAAASASPPPASYLRSITSETLPGESPRGDTYSAEYGPEAARADEMPYEGPSPGQNRHPELDQSGERAGDSLATDVRTILREVLW